MMSARVMYSPPEGVPNEFAPAHTAIERLCRKEAKQETAKQAADEDDQRLAIQDANRVSTTAARPLRLIDAMIISQLMINERRVRGSRRNTNTQPHCDCGRAKPGAAFR